MIKVITDLVGFYNSDKYWDEVKEFCDIFTLKQWLLTWWKCYGEENELKIYVAFDENNTVKVILPLMIKKENEYILLTQLSDSCSDYFRAICDTTCLNYLKEIFCYILKNEEYKSFIIKNLRTDEPQTNLLITAAYSCGASIDVKVQEKNYYIDTKGSYEIYFQNKSNNFRHKINHVRKNLNMFSFENVDYYDDTILDELMGLHRTKWKRDLQVSVFNDTRRMNFLREICKELSDLGFLKIFILRYKEKIIAYRLGFIYNNVYHDWNTSYDVEYSKMSVGILLCDYITRYCFENNINEFDFLRGEETYKQKFATDNRNLLQVEIKKMVISNDNVFLPPKVKNRRIMENIKGFIFDLDGVVYKGNKPIINSIDFINFLLDQKIGVGFLTNTSSKCCDTIQKTICSMGIKDDSYIIETSSIATAEYMNENNIKQCVVYGGDNVLEEEIRKKGIKIVGLYDGDISVDAVIVGYSKEYKYDDLVRIYELIKSGAKLIATDEDKVFAHNGKCLPGTAWIVSSIEAVTNKKAYIIGKPNSYSALSLLKKMKMNPKEVLIIGDNIESDIKVAKEIGAACCLLLGGVSGNEDLLKLKTEERPDFVISDLNELRKFVKEHNYE